MNYLNYYVQNINESTFENFLLKNKKKLLILGMNLFNFFENSDFCLFQNFPQKKLVFPRILIKNFVGIYETTSCESLNCSCSILWLLMNSDYYKKILIFQITTKDLIIISISQ